LAGAQPHEAVALKREEILDAARAGDLERLGEHREEVARAIQSLADAGDGTTALELATKAWRIWYTRGELEAGSAALSAALDAPGAEPPTVERARALYADGLCAFRAGDRDRSQGRNEDALRVARAVSDTPSECQALTGLARIALRDGEYSRVVELAQEAWDLARAAGAEITPLHLIAAGVRLGGDYERARELYLESLERNRELGNHGWVAAELQNLGWVDLHLGDVDSAEARFRERDTIDYGPDAYGAAWRDLSWSAIAAARGERDEALRLFESGKAALAELGLTLDPDDQFELDWLTAQLR
jgi:tetratricopeptide (TPR) repeat protein